MQINCAVQIVSFLKQILVVVFAVTIIPMPTFPPSEPVPTKEDAEKKEKQERKLMLMDAGRRAEALAQFQEEEERKKLEREMAETARRKEAATGVFRCLLELKQPVAAAEAAKTRLASCETPEERRQVRFVGLKTVLYRTPKTIK